ncbi:archaellin/type IV pilin N-terminal domain-containing protein [Halorussus halobius]|uniref:archaellin/type IV pilin N-terminal domain-containing protein n=1 Tax=Halorussus halobius TaxID=1710537 RepID=UPI001092F88F|nr:archaellin/type IV pilin N-terminal domain-containing protein [Halorussus halobius]
MSEDESSSERGQVGIGTLVVFIAMVLVAAIAAGVLVNTAGFLQSKSEQTGQDSTAQVSNRVQVVSAYAEVGFTDLGFPTAGGTYKSGGDVVDYAEVVVTSGSGAGTVDLRDATITWNGPNRTQHLTWRDPFDREENAAKIAANTTRFSAVSLTDDDPALLDETGDRLKIAIDAEAISDDANDDAYVGDTDPPGGFYPGQEATIRITTSSGAVTTYQLTVPDTLAGKHAVSL